MIAFTRRLWAALICLAACGALLAAPQVQAQTPATVTSLNLETDTVAEALAPDLGALLAAAQYNRGPSSSGGPRNRITSVTRLGNAIRAHNGVAYVATAERGDGDIVRLKSIYRLEGTPIGADAGPASPGSTKAAVSIDLSADSLSTLHASLDAHLGTLLTQDGTDASLDQAIADLDQPQQVAYLVLAERAGETGVTNSRVFVVPDVLRISVVDDAAAAAGAAAAGEEEPPEVELVPAPDGGPPLIKFEFDPAKYEGKQ
jgi:hypothetical protein